MMFAWGAALTLAGAYLALGHAVDAVVLGHRIGGWSLLVLVLAPVAIGWCTWAGAAGMPRAASRVEAQYRDAILRHVFVLAPTQRGREQKRRIVLTATDGVERAAGFQATVVGPVIASMTLPVVILALMAWAIDLRSALWLALTLPTLPLVIGGFYLAFKAAWTRYRTASEEFSSEYLDSLQGLPTLRALGAARSRREVCAESAQNARRRVLRLLVGDQLVLLVDTAFSLGVVTLAAWLAVTRLGDGAITSGQALAIVLLSTLLVEPWEKIGKYFHLGTGGILARREIKAFLASAPPAPSAATTSTRSTSGPHAIVRKNRMPRTTGPHPVIDLDPAGSGRIRLDQVTFAYDQCGPVLRGASLEVAPGERVALMGDPGVGKSTVLQLVQGRYHPQSGAVSLRGINLCDVYGGWANRQCAVVPQTTYLFSGTLAANLRIAAPQASDEELWQALDDANLSSEVRAWPRGLDTIVGMRGKTVSSGQAQRVAIARAMLKNAPIVLLDEPASQIDVDSEALIVDALTKLTVGRTVLLVTRRELLTQLADRIVVMVDGALVPSDEAVGVTGSNSVGDAP